MYKKALNAFFLKVHPDFFHHNHEQQVINENAVAQLNELLSWAKEYKKGILKAPPSTSITFTFYQRTHDDDVDDDINSSRNNMEDHISGSSSAKLSRYRYSHASSNLDNVALQSTFQLPSNFVATDGNRGMVERAVNKFLRDLLRRANCLDSVSESLSVAEDAAASRAEARPLRRRAEPQHQRNKQQVKSLLDEASETLSLKWSITEAPSLDELMEADHILFSRELAPLECAAALHTLRHSLGELKYELWESMPLIISNEFSIGTLSGTITIPWDFTPRQFVSFLAHNSHAVEACRESALKFASSLEEIMTDLCFTLSWDDVLISCGHKEAMPTLQLLQRNKELLRAHGVTDLTIEITSGPHATRANGVIIINNQLRTLDALQEWFQNIQPKLALQQKLYKLSKQMLETTMWHLTEFRNMVEPAGIDCFDNNDCTYAQRLEWAKELFRIGASLAQWDWSEFTFTLSERLEIDWEHRQLSLPYNFDGDAILRYIEDVQLAARQAHREELINASAMQRAKEHEDLARQHAKELLIPDNEAEDMAQDEEQDLDHETDTTKSSGTRGDSKDMISKENGDHNKQVESDQDERTKQRKLRNMYRRTNPHLEEYLVSSPDKVDPLSVERPLTHAVHFNSHTEAADQLKWEGFEEPAIVDQWPTMDVDDMNYTYMQTNRWHRQEAAKKLLENLREQYGKKSRRFPFQKMGDVLEINNAKVQPKGFPTLVRGVRNSGE